MNADGKSLTQRHRGAEQRSQRGGERSKSFLRASVPLCEILCFTVLLSCGVITADDAASSARPVQQSEKAWPLARGNVLAEAYYVAIAPHHDGGPVATAAAIQFAASVPNFFIQHVPLPHDPRDREMRAAIVRGGKFQLKPIEARANHASE